MACCALGDDDPEQVVMAPSRAKLIRRIEDQLESLSWGPSPESETGLVELTNKEVAHLEQLLNEVLEALYDLDRGSVRDIFEPAWKVSRTRGDPAVVAELKVRAVFYVYALERRKVQARLKMVAQAYGVGVGAIKKWRHELRQAPKSEPHKRDQQRLADLNSVDQTRLKMRWTTADAAPVLAALKKDGAVYRRVNSKKRTKQGT